MTTRLASGAGEFLHIVFVLLVSTAAGGLAVGAFAGLHELTNPGRTPDSELVWLIPAMSLEGIGIFFGAAITVGLKLGMRHLSPEERPTAALRLRKIRLRFTAASGGIIVLGSLLALRASHWRNVSQWVWLAVGTLTACYVIVAWIKEVRPKERERAIGAGSEGSGPP